MEKEEMPTDVLVLYGTLKMIRYKAQKVPESENNEKSKDEYINDLSEALNRIVDLANIGINFMERRK